MDKQYVLMLFAVIYIVMIGIDWFNKKIELRVKIFKTIMNLLTIVLIICSIV